MRGEKPYAENLCNFRCDKKLYRVGLGAAHCFGMYCDGLHLHIPSERLVEYESAAHDLPMMDHEIAIISAAQKDDPHALSALHEILASRPNGLGMYDIHISASDEATVTADVSVVGGNADLLQTFRDNMEQSGVFHGLRIKAVENDAVHGQTVILSAWRDKQ